MSDIKDHIVPNIQRGVFVDVFNTPSQTQGGNRPQKFGRTKGLGRTIKEFRVLGVYLEATKNLGHICNCKKTTTLWLFLKRLGFMTQMTVKVLNAEGNHGGKDSHTPESY